MVRAKAKLNKFFNSNSANTYIAFIGLIGFPLVVFLLGCVGDDVMTPDIVEAISCKNSWLTPEMVVILTPLLAGIQLFIKGHFRTGTISENLLNSSVPITEEGKKGTVTEAQVASSNPQK